MADRKSPTNRLAIALLLGVAGFLGNWFNLPIFFNVDFLFGSFFVMLAVARYGVAAALIAGVIAGSCSFLLWNHPWAIIIFTAEALFVSLLNRRHPGKLVILDTLYWLCMGMPLVWLLYQSVMGMGAEATLLVALKQSINGIFNALLATTFIYCVQLVKPAREGKKQLIPLSQLVFTAMVAVSIVPSFVSLVQGVRGEVLAMEKDILRRVNSIADSSRDILNVWITSNQQSVISLAQLVGDPNTASFDHMQRHAEALKMANPTLLRLVVANRRATSVAFAPLVDATGKSALGIDYSDRTFITELLRLRKPLVSDLEVARVGPPVPRLAFVAPVVSSGEYRGFCAGIVNLDRLAEQLTILAKDRFANVTVLDRQGRVVISSSDRWQRMQQFGRPTGGEVRRFADGSYHWIPEPRKMTSMMQRWQGSLFAKEVKLSDELPWTIVTEGSLTPYLNRLNRKTIDELLLLWEQIILTLVVSYLISRGLALSLQRLETISAELPQTIATNTHPSWPETRIGELSNLVGNFRLMTAALADHIRKLRHLNDELELRVEERTGNLRESEERFRSLFERHSAVMLLIDPSDGDIISANEAAAAYYGYSRDELCTMRIEQINCLPPDLITAALKRFLHHEINRVFFPHRRASGEIRTVEAHSAPIQLRGRTVLFSIIHDVTEQMQAEQALQRLNFELEQRVSERTADLERLNKELESFCHSISHEMRAPIARLEGFSRMLIECDPLSDPDAQQHCAERIEAASRQLRAVIDSLLMMNRLSRAEMTSSPVDLSRMAQQVVDELLEGVGQRSLHVTIAPDIVVRGDRYMLEICMRNLLGNAVKYTSKTPDPAIEFGRTERSGVEVCYVRDNGAGFDMAFADKLFRPFSRLHNNDEFEGSGIGLATVQQIIERHGGRIWAEASPGTGAVFWFTLGESRDRGHGDFDAPGV